MLEKTPGTWSSGDKQGRLTVPRDLFGSLLQARLHSTQWVLIADNLAPNCLKSCQNNKNLPMIFLLKAATNDKA